MTWFAFARGLNQRRKTQLLREDVMDSVTTPEATHPALGLAGRSIELSIAVGNQIDPEQVQLAADELHDHLLSEDWPREELLQSAIWLDSVSCWAVSSTVRSQIASDVARLRR